MVGILVPAARVALLSCSFYALLTAAARATSLDNTLSAEVGGFAPLVVAIGDPGPYLAVETESTGPLADGLGNQAIATSTWKAFPHPTVQGTAGALAGSNASVGPTFARATVDIRFSYGITLSGPSGPAVSAPIFFQGRTSGSGSGPGVSGSTVFQYTGGPLTELGGSTATPLAFEPGVTWTLDPGCATGCGFDHTFTFQSVIGLGNPFSLLLEGLLDVEADEPGEGSFGEIMIDPYIYLDPAWAAAHPEYTLVIEPGVFNVVPEPATAWLLLAGLGALGRCRREGMGAIARR